MNHVLSVAAASLLCLVLSGCVGQVAPVTAKNDTVTAPPERACVSPPWAHDLAIPGLLADVRMRLADDHQAFATLLDVIQDGVKTRLLTPGGQPKAVPANDLKEFVADIHEALNKARASSIAADAATKADLKLFDDAVGYYFTALFEGKYVDRFGATLTAPTVSMTISDSEIGGGLAVLVDVIMDFVMRTPVWVDNPAQPKKFYPAEEEAPGKQPTPTAVAFNKQEIADGVDLGKVADGTTWKWTPLLMISGQTGACLIDERKLQVVEYVAGLVKQEASGITGLTVGNFGGFGVSLGVFGKFSVGDNKTVQVLLQTLIAKVFGRIAAEETLRGAYYVDDSGRRIGEIIDAVLKVKLPAPSGQ